MKTEMASSRQFLPPQCKFLETYTLENLA